MKRKVVKTEAEPIPLVGVAAGAAAGGFVGAVVGKTFGRTNGSAAAGAAIGAVAGGAIAWPAPVRDAAQMVLYLHRNLGPRTTAYLSGVNDVGLVGLWGRGESVPDYLPLQRLRSAYEATRCLVEAYDAQTARSWFMGMNPGFDDESPARMLRKSIGPETWTKVELAARQFAET